MKNTILIVFLAFQMAFGQAPSLEWAHQIAGASNDMGNALVTDSLGNVYSTGSFTATNDFDPGPGTTNLTSAGADDLFVLKMDGAGNFVWARRVGGTLNDRGNGLAVDPLGNVYITGTFQQTVDFDPGPGTSNLSSPGGEKCFVLKLDANGDFLWAVHFEANASNYGRGIATDDVGNVYLTGEFGGTADFDPGPGTFNLSAAATDLFTVKLDAAGNLVWAVKQGGSSTEVAYALDLDVDGNVYTTGDFGGFPDFDPGPGSFVLSPTGGGQRSCFISKLDGSGGFVWAKMISGTDEVLGESIELDADKNVVLGGYFYGTADFDPGGATFNQSATGSTPDAFIAKLDSMGNFAWAKRIGYDQIDNCTAVGVDKLGNVIATGLFEGTVDLDPGPGVQNATSAYSDIFVVKLDPNGNFGWAGHMGGTFGDLPRSIALGSNGQVFIAGGFNGTSDFDPGPGSFNLTSFGNSFDIFLVKLNQCQPLLSTQTASACDSYTWPATGSTYTASGAYTTTLTNAAGCDSTLTLNLTIYTLAASISASANTLTATPAGATYQWLDCNNGYAPVNGATGQVFSPASSGAFAVLVTQNGCSDTSACESVVLTGALAGASLPEITLYPNPSEGLVYLDLGQVLPNGRITLLDLAGKQVQESQFESRQQMQLDLRAQAAGIYFLQIHTETFTKTLKLIVD